MLKVEQNPRLLQAISSLKGNPDFEIFLSWVRESYDYLSKLVIKDGVTLDHTHRVNQGRAFSCLQIIEVVDNAEDKIRKIKEGGER